MLTNLPIYSEFVEGLNSLKNILTENDFNTDGLVDNIFYNSLSILDLLIDEISNDKMGILIVGITSAGKSTLLNYILDCGNEMVIRESAKNETRVILRIRNSFEKYVCVNMKPGYKFKDLPEIIKEQLININVDNIFNDKSSFNIQLNSTEYLNYFHILMEKNENIYDPAFYIENFDLFYPLKYFKNYFLYDSPGFASSLNDTDYNVEKNLFARSVVIWLFNGSHPECSDVISYISNHLDYFKNIEKEKLFFISNFLDELESKIPDWEDELSISEYLITKFQKFTIKNDLKYSVMSFSVFKKQILESYPKYSEITSNTILEIEDLLVKNKKKIELLNLKKAEQSHKLFNSLFEKLDKIIEENNQKIISIEKKIDSLKVSLERKINNIIPWDKIVNDKDIISKINIICELIEGSSSRKDYNSYLKELSDYCLDIPKNLKEPILAFSGLLEDDKKILFSIIDENEIKENLFERYKMPWRPYIWKLRSIYIFKDGVESKNMSDIKTYLSDLQNNLRNKYKEIKENLISKLSSEYDEKINEENFNKKTIIEKISKHQDLNKKIKKNIDNIRIGLDSILFYINDSILNWEEPVGNNNSNQKLESFLELVKNINYSKYLSILKNE